LIFTPSRVKSIWLAAGSIAYPVYGWLAITPVSLDASAATIENVAFAVALLL